jgi:hypothetical protein
MQRVLRHEATNLSADPLRDLGDFADVRLQVIDSPLPIRGFLLPRQFIEPLPEPGLIYGVDLSRTLAGERVVVLSFSHFSLRNASSGTDV